MSYKLNAALKAGEGDQKSKSKMDENVKLGDKAAKEGKEWAGTTLFRWSPDWEKAANYYKDAAKYYNLCLPNYAAAYVDALKNAANAYEKQDQHASYNPAGVHYEQAAIQMAKSPEGLVAATNLSTNYSDMFRLAGQSDKSASMLMKAGQVIGEVDVSAAITFMSDACAIFESENRGMFAHDTFVNSVSYLVKKTRYKETIELLHRQNKVYLTLLKTFENDLYKNFLSIIVLRFKLQEYDQAAKEFAEFCHTAKYGTSAEAEAADMLINAFDSGDEKDWEKAVKLQTFTFLPNSIALVARHLKLDVKAVAERKEKKKRRR